MPGSDVQASDPVPSCWPASSASKRRRVYRGSPPVREKSAGFPAAVVVKRYQSDTRRFYESPHGLRGEARFDAMNEEFFQRFYQRAAPLCIHQAGGNGALYTGMDLRGAHSEFSGQGCIRPLAFTQRDNFQENNYVLWFENHGAIRNSRIAQALFCFFCSTAKDPMCEQAGVIHTIKCAKYSNSSLINHYQVNNLLGACLP